MYLNQAILRSRQLGNPGENRETIEKQKALLSVWENRAPVQPHPQPENTRLQRGLLNTKDSGSEVPGRTVLRPSASGAQDIATYKELGGMGGCVGIVGGLQL